MPQSQVNFVKQKIADVSLIQKKIAEVKISALNLMGSKFNVQSFYKAVAEQNNWVWPPDYGYPNKTLTEILNGFNEHATILLPPGDHVMSGRLNSNYQFTFVGLKEISSSTLVLYELQEFNIKTHNMRVITQNIDPDSGAIYATNCEAIIVGTRINVLDLRHSEAHFNIGLVDYLYMLDSSASNLYQVDSLYIIDSSISGLDQVNFLYMRNSSVTNLGNVGFVSLEGRNLLYYKPLTMGIHSCADPGAETTAIIFQYFTIDSYFSGNLTLIPFYSTATISAEYVELDIPVLTVSSLYAPVERVEIMLNNVTGRIGLIVLPNTQLELVIDSVSSDIAIGGYTPMDVTLTLPNETPKFGFGPTQGGG